MENLSREAILRMLSGKTGNSSSSGGGGDIDLAGYATSIWVTENFVSIDFFRELFRAFDSSSNEILPNDTTSVVASIKAMVGTWTEQYLTALGNAGGGGGGGGGAGYLNDLLDVELTTPITDGQALVYNATIQKWVNGSAGVNMTTVWNALAGSTNEQINASHLTSVLSGYATTSAISDMATQTWVGQQGFATQTWVTSNFITIAYFDRLFRAYNNTTLVSHNDTTTTIDNIKAMFGFWTDFYLSALGTGGVSSVSISLSQLADVNVAGVTNGQALVYDATSNKWVTGTIQTGVSSLSSLSDVLLTSLQHNQVLIYDAYAAKWVNSSLKTVNGYSLLGSGNIDASGGGSGNYLPLSGGTMTGSIEYVGNSGTFHLLGAGSSSIDIGWDYATNSGSGIGLRSRYIPNKTDDNGALILYCKDGINTKHFYLYPNGKIWWGASELTSLFCMDSNGNVGLGSRDTTNWKFHIYGNAGDKTPTLLVDGLRHSQWNFISSLLCPDQIAGDEAVLILGKNHDSYNAGVINFGCTGFGLTSNRLSFGLINSNYILNIVGNGNVGIGTTSPSSLLTVESQTSSTQVLSNFVQPSLSVNNYNVIGFGRVLSEFNAGLLEFYYVGSGSLSNYISLGFYGNDFLLNILGNGNVGIGTTSPSFKLTVAGDVYATGAVTALSDIRHKTVIKDAAVSVEDIARMPAVMYQWNDGREDKELHVGSIAQNWQTVLPEVVLKANDNEGTLSMQYGVAALVSSIIIARKVVNHEERIKQLEKENKELKLKLKIA